MLETKVPVGISARHIHVSQADLDVLYGEGYQLTVKKDLSQLGQFAANETVDLVTEKSSFKNVRILGPVRNQTQVEIALTDALKLKISIPVRDSGDTKGSAGITVVGPKGTVVIKEGVIAAGRHIHMNTADAEKFGVKDKDIVKVRCDGERGLVFENVLIRVHESFCLEMHIDTDEANAAMCKNGGTVEIIK
ncbi:phosphate propanoyltransferase [Pelosinus sp. IPA-1]|uniref:phosphate propanoyltransferase n=1 Tax=Pelosinus sp. IPA-1 TaxID=3029569 RepID=UPI00243622C2|nr:phosphate propanoyltransferase [Pelosinus sp. IPA-1]GMA99604.1 phosphate propanoyltransferase [Pelosinus sp. IPA-1]